MSELVGREREGAAERTRSLETMSAAVLGGLGGTGVPAAGALLVVGWVDTPRYLALVAASLVAYAFALWIAEWSSRTPKRRR